MPRTAAELRAAATATGTFNGPVLNYVGDGYSVPYQVSAGDFPLGFSHGMLAYKTYLDKFYKEFSRLHDWLYTPYGALINATREESDLALREELGTQSPIDAEVVYRACQAFGFLYFGLSAVGYRGDVVTGQKPDMPLADNRIFKQEGSDMAIKAVILFQQTTTVGNAAPDLNYTGVARTAGWSESLYGPATVADIVKLLKGPSEVAGRFPLLQARANILSSSASILGVRLYQSGAGKGQLLNVQYNGTNGASDQPSASLLCSALSSATGQSRRWTIRGFADDDIKFGEYTAVGSTPTRLKEYFDSLSGFGWQAQLETNKVKIEKISAAGVIDLADVSPISTGTWITIKNTTRKSDGVRLGGRFKVVATGVKTLTIDEWTNGATKGGTLSVVTQAFQDFANAVKSVVRATNRRVGRPFSGYRGRKSRKTSLA